MIVKVFKDIYVDGNYQREKDYDIDIPEEKLIEGITTKTPEYWYVLIDGKVFKSDQEKGLKSIFFPTKEAAENKVANALYWRRKLVPDIGCAVGYDTETFYDELLKTHNVEFKTIKL